MTRFADCASNLASVRHWGIWPWHICGTWATHASFRQPRSGLLADRQQIGKLYLSASWPCRRRVTKSGDVVCWGTPKIFRLLYAQVVLYITSIE